MGDFELNVTGWYTPQNVEENVFLNDKLETDQYGIYYSVKFEGDAETYLWQAKAAPVEGERYWGHIEKSKSGKSLRFKKDKLEEGTTSSVPSKGTPDYEPSTNTRWAIGMAYRAYVTVSGGPIEDASMWDGVRLNAQNLLGLFDELKNGGSVGHSPPLKEADPPPATIKKKLAESDWIPDET